MGLGGEFWADVQGTAPTYRDRSWDGDGFGWQDSRGGFGAQLVMEGLWSPILDNITGFRFGKLFNKAYVDGAFILTRGVRRPISGATTVLLSRRRIFVFASELIVLFAAVTVEWTTTPMGISTKIDRLPGTAKMF